jgi:flagellar export protein FliJ
VPKFSFKLQTLLKVKTQQEDNLKNELGKAIRKLEEENSILRRIEFEKNKYIFEFNEKSRKTTVNNLIKFNNYISHLTNKIMLQKENINLASHNVDKVREDLIKIVKEREILDKLKDKKYAEYLIEQNKDEQKINDEIISYKHTGNDTGD